ncbi:MAG: winged helix-turn-helix domain-containing protein, partial [Planctomycetia bacterium]|nr:winged helix-turn-helix domain-containing protein [Planctomycetia bacterium]
MLEHDELIRKIVSERPDITASEIQDMLPVTVCLETIYKTLKRLGFTYKKSLHAAEQNRPDVLEKRKNWKNELKNVDLNKT